MVLEAQKSVLSDDQEPACPSGSWWPWATHGLQQCRPLVLPLCSHGLLGHACLCFTPHASLTRTSDSGLWPHPKPRMISPVCKWSTVFVTSENLEASYLGCGEAWSEPPLPQLLLLHLLPVLFPPPPFHPPQTHLNQSSLPAGPKSRALLIGRTVVRAP